MATADPHARVPFGAADVDAGDKQRLVRGVFDHVAARYDLMNDLMSLGVHRLWKRRLIAALEPTPDRLLDLAGGTGDIAERVRARFADCAVTVCDINQAMLEAGRERAWDRGLVGGIDWLCADGEALPLAASRFDACTCAFGIRNMTHPERAYGEIARVLRPGGRFLFLEFTPAVAPILRRAYQRYSETVIPTLGRLITGDADAYRYLVESIKRFPVPDILVGQVAAAGFGGVRATPLSGGVAVLISAWRI